MSLVATLAVGKLLVALCSLPLIFALRRAMLSLFWHPFNLVVYCTGWRRWFGKLSFYYVVIRWLIAWRIVAEAGWVWCDDGHIMWLNVRVCLC
jgi:hypothetical protein